MNVVLFGKIMDLDSALVFLEWSSVLLNVVFILLLTKEKAICWLFGIMGSLSGSVLFFYQNYYSESILYLFYAIVGLYAWILWTKPKSHLVVKRIKGIATALLVGLGLVVTLILGRLGDLFNGDKPYFDAFSTAFGIIATFLEMYKYLSAWVYWIVLNLFSIWLYGIKGLWVYAALMLVYAVLSVNGFVQWRKKLQK
ncbi:MAG: nicotinamide mononucleotide transporter [Bacteroidia bacterium]